MGIQRNYCYCAPVKYDGPKPRYRKIKLGGEWGVVDRGDVRRWMPAMDENDWHYKGNNEAGEYDGGEEYAQELADSYNSDSFNPDNCGWCKSPRRPDKPEPFSLYGIEMARINGTETGVIIPNPYTNFVPGEIEPFIEWLNEAREYLDFYGEE